MTKNRSHQLGFSVVEGMLVVLTIAAVSFMAWYVWHNQRITTTTSKTSTATPDAKTPATNSQDPYKGWQVACSSYGGLCVKYPAGWKYSSSPTPTYDANGNKTGQTSQINIVSPSNAVQVVYNPSEQTPVAVGNPLPFTLLSLETPSNAQGYKILKGITALPNGQYSADLYVTSAAKVAQYHITDGANDGYKLYNDANQFQTATVHQNIFQTLSVGSRANQGFYANFNSRQAAQAWLTNPEVKTATLILASLSKN